VNYEVTIGSTTFANPVLAASGTFGFGTQLAAVANRLGGVVTKAITLAPRQGNPPPRICEFPGGIINSVGLENPGLERFRTDVLPVVRRLKCRVVVNVAGFTPDEFRELVTGLNDDRVDAIELNVSCPNVNEGGAIFGQRPEMVEDITRGVRNATPKTLVVKLTANFVDPAETAKAAEAAGADAVTVINTLFGMAMDESGQPFLGARTGGISGPALKPFALYCVDRVASAVRIPVIGCGGIMSGKDAQDFLSAGARMVQVGTASLANPRAALAVWQQLQARCRLECVKAWDEVIGRARR